MDGVGGVVNGVESGGTRRRRMTTVLQALAIGRLWVRIGQGKEATA